MRRVYGAANFQRSVNWDGFVWFDFFVKCHINLRGVINAEAIFVEEQ